MARTSARGRWAWTVGSAAVLAAAGCTGLGPDDAVFQARARTLPSVEGTLLETTLEIHNASNQTRTWVYGGCWSGSGVRIYRLGSSTAASWDSAPPPAAACAAVRIELRLAPGQRQTLVRQDRVEEILGDSLPPGRYRITVRPSFQGVALPELDVGQHDLTF
ncbi:MAG: hypothetical protein R3E10_06995 [Gemmatimonadota bacterium]